MEPSNPLALIAVGLIALTAALATAAALVERLRALDPIARREALVTSVALFAVAFLARWSTAPHTLVHENHHAYDYVATAGLPLAEAALLHGVPSTHRLLAALTHRALSGAHDPVFALDVTLSALGVPAIFWLAARSFGGRLAGVAAASLLMFQPHALFLAPTEESLNLVVAAAIAGMALLQTGVAEASRPSLVAGCALVAVAATAREITLPLAALAPLALLSARRPPRLPWWAPLAACAALGVALAPQLFAILAARSAHAESSALVSMPHLPFPGDVGSPILRDRVLNRYWVGWVEPYIPFWMGAAMCASWAVLSLRCLVRRDLHLACVGLLAPVVAVAQGGLTANGWFPSGLRHELFAMALCLLPVAWLYAAAARRLPPRLLPAAWLLAPAAALIAADRGGFADAAPLPMAMEYRFVRAALASMRPGDRFVVLTGPDIHHIPARWVTTVRPDVRPIPAEALAAGAGAGSGGPIWLVTDRVCALDRECFRNPSLCGSSGYEAPRPLGEVVNEECAAALRARPWRLVRSARTCAPSPGHYPQPYDLPPRRRCATLGLYRWSAD
jgi:hypothetical protein